MKVIDFNKYKPSKKTSRSSNNSNSASIVIPHPKVSYQARESALIRQGILRGPGLYSPEPEMQATYGKNVDCSDEKSKEAVPGKSKTNIDKC